MWRWVKALMEADTVGAQRRWRQQTLSLLFITLVLYPLGRSAGGEPALLKGVWALRLFLLLTLYTALGRHISVFGVLAPGSQCEVLTHGLRSCRGHELLPPASCQQQQGSLVSATAPGKHWGSGRVSWEKDGARDYQTRQSSICSVCALAGGKDLAVDRLYFLILGLPLTPRAGAAALQQELEHASSLVRHEEMPAMMGTCLSH